MDPKKKLDAEDLRRQALVETNQAVASDDPVAERARLSAAHGRVWDTAELTADFAVEGFLAPFVVARRLADDMLGTLRFQHWPRFYFSWEPDSE
jgi:hypothetical protein